MDPDTLLEHLVTQISFHGDRGVRLDDVFRELADAGVQTDAAQQAFLRRALLDVKGLATLPDRSGVPKRARASARLQERALGVRCDRLHLVQAAILRAVAQSRSVGCTINSLRQVVNLEPLQIHPHASSLVRLGLISRTLSSDRGVSFALLRLVRFTQAAPLEPDAEMALTRAAVVRLLEQMPGGAVYAESVPGAVGLSRQAAGVLIHQLSTQGSMATASGGAKEPSGTAAAPAAFADATDEASSAPDAPLASSLLLVMDVMGGGGGGSEKAPLPPSRPCFLLNRPVLPAAPLSAPSVTEGSCWAWPGTARPDAANAVPATSCAPRFAALELAGAAQAYRMLLLRAPRSDGLAAVDLQHALGQRHARALHDFEGLVDDLDLLQGGGLTKVPRGRAHVIGAIADRALTAQDPHVAREPGEELREAGLRRLVAAWEDPFSASVRAAMRDHARRLVGAAHAVACVDPALLGGVVLALSDGAIVAAGQYAAAAAAPADLDGDGRGAVGAASEIVLYGGGSSAAMSAPVSESATADAAHPGDVLFTALLRARGRKGEAEAANPPKILVAPCSRHLTALVSYVRLCDAAAQLEVGDDSVFLPAPGVSVSASHTGVDAAALATLPVPRKHRTANVEGREEGGEGDGGLAALEDADGDGGSSCSESGDPGSAVPPVVMTTTKRRRSSRAVAVPRKKQREVAAGELQRGPELVSLTALLHDDDVGGDDGSVAPTGAAADGGSAIVSDVKAVGGAPGLAASRSVPRRPAARRLAVQRAAAALRAPVELESIPPIPPVPVSFAASFLVPLAAPNSRRRPQWLQSDERRLVFAWAWQRVFTERTAQERFRVLSERLVAARQDLNAQLCDAPAALVEAGEGCEAGAAGGVEDELMGVNAEATTTLAPPLVPRTYSVDYHPVSVALGGIDCKSIVRRLKYIERRRPAAIAELSNVLARLRELLGVTAFTGAAGASGHITARFSMSAPLSAEPPGEIAAVLPTLTEEWIRGATVKLPGDDTARPQGGMSEESSAGSSEEGVDDDAEGEVGGEGVTAVSRSLKSAGRKRQRSKADVAGTAGSAEADVAAASVTEEGSEDTSARCGSAKVGRHVAAAAAAAPAVASSMAVAASSAPLSDRLAGYALSYGGPAGVEVDAGAARGGLTDPFCGAHNDEAVALWKVLRVVAQRSDRLQARIAADARGAAPPSDTFLVALLRELGQDMDVPACFAVLTQKRLVGGIGESGVELKSKATRGSYSAAPRVVDLYCGGAPLGRISDPTAFSADLIAGWPELPRAQGVAPAAVRVGDSSGVRECVSLFDSLASGSFPRVDFQTTDSAPAPVAGVAPAIPVASPSPEIDAGAAAEKDVNQEAAGGSEIVAERLFDVPRDSSDSKLGSDEEPPGLERVNGTAALAEPAELGQLAARRNEHAARVVIAEARSAHVTTNIDVMMSRAQKVQRRLVAAGLLPCSYVPEPEAVVSAPEGPISYRKTPAREKIQLLQMSVVSPPGPAECAPGQSVMPPPPESRLSLFCDEPFGQAAPPRSAVAAVVASLQAHTERLAVALRSAARATILAAGDTGKHGVLLAESARRVALSAPGAPALSRVRLGAAAVPPAVLPPPPLLLMLAARAALREELAVSPDLEAMAGFHGEVLISTGTALARSVFTVSAATEGRGARRLFRSWTALLSGRPGDAVRVEAGAVWALASRVVTLVSDAQSLSEARVIAALSPVAPADVRALLRFLCSRGILDRAYRLAGALPPSSGPFSPLWTASSLAAHTKAAVLAAIVPPGDDAARDTFFDGDPDVLLRAAADAWFTVATPQFREAGDSAAEPTAAAAAVVEWETDLSGPASIGHSDTGEISLERLVASVLAELNRAPCDILELPGIVTSYSLSMQTFRALQSLVADLRVQGGIGALPVQPTQT